MRSDTVHELPKTEDLIKKLMLTIEVSWANQLSLQDIQNWLSNFKGEALGSVEEEQNIAMWLLYNFVYYNESEVKHLCKLMLKKYIHNEIKYSDKDVTLLEIEEIMKKSKFLSIGNSSESGSYILYLFRQENDLPVKFFNDPSRGINVSDNIVFIDDMTLSGSQASKRINGFKYSGANFKTNEIGHDFIQKLIEAKDDSLELYIKNKINSVSPISEELFNVIPEGFVNAINDNIVKNKNLYSDILNYLSSTQITSKTSILVNKLKSGQLCKTGVYRANRALLEDYFGKGLLKGIDNFSNESIYLLTFFASVEAITELSRIGVKVLPCIMLDDQSKVFSDSSMVFAKYPEIKSKCKQMCKHYGKKIYPDHPLGYKEGSYSFGLYYTIPNNSLPIFWAYNEWLPIFTRHDKNYGGMLDVFGRYV
jgi:hypothetical protein